METPSVCSPGFSNLDSIKTANFFDDYLLAKCKPNCLLRIKYKQAMFSYLKPFLYSKKGVVVWAFHYFFYSKVLELCVATS